MRIIVALVLVSAVSACGSAGSACESAVREASEISAMEDTVGDLDQAIEECATLSELEAAADQFPDALDGAAVRTFVANRCEFEPTLAGTAICAEVGE